MGAVVLLGAALASQACLPACLDRAVLFTLPEEEEVEEFSEESSEEEEPGYRPVWRAV